MVNYEKRQFTNDQWTDDVNQTSGDDESVNISLSSVKAPASASSSITRRLTGFFLEDGDEDLLLQRNDRENDVLQWIGALDMRVMGACRAGERLKPLLKLNVSTGMAEDRLLTHLSQRHFKPSEVGHLAKCLCVPLVSIRVGKINKQGTFLSPTSRKMKDMVMRKPSLAELSGISEARLNCFASHLRTYLAGSMVINAHAGGFLSASPPADDSVDSTELHFLQLGSCIPQTNSQGSKTNLIYQDSLCPRSDSFEEGLAKSLSSVKIAGREKLRGRENSEKHVSCVDDILNISDLSSSFISEKDKLPVANGINPFATLNFVDAFGKSA
ncbi:hypothetical protein DH2020_010401 [Rehmannia glutinosa]|uniref:Uncharacterized protein n=1 Tax=Rehmannia glutinosa TaxID=99300 RepID=A0ABR0XAJ0_REHGL